jgi:Protein of unknown function (DUF1453)
MGPGFQGAGGQTYGLVIAVVVALAVVLLRNRRPRKLRVEALWMRPVLFVAVIAATMAAALPRLTAASLGAMILAAAIGAALGWQRGRFMQIDVDPETHAMTSSASPAGLLFIVAILALRMGLRGVLLQNRWALGVPAATISDGLILLVGATMITQSLEMWLRARRLLEASRAAKASAVTPRIDEPIVR